MMMILDFIFDYLFREDRYSVSTTASTVPVGELVGRIIGRDVREIKIIWNKRIGYTKTCREDMQGKMNRRWMEGIAMKGRGWLSEKEV